MPNGKNIKRMDLEIIVESEIAEEVSLEYRPAKVVYLGRSKLSEYTMEKTQSTLSSEN